VVPPKAGHLDPKPYVRHLAKKWGSLAKIKQMYSLVRGLEPPKAP